MLAPRATHLSRKGAQRDSRSKGPPRYGAIACRRILASTIRRCFPETHSRKGAGTDRQTPVGGGRLLSLRGSRRSLPRRQQARSATRRFLLPALAARVGSHCRHAKTRIPMTGRHRMWTSRNRVGREGACSSFVQRESSQGCVKASAPAAVRILTPFWKRLPLVEAPGADRSETHQPEAHESVCSTSLLSHKLIHSTA